MGNINILIVEKDSLIAADLEDRLQDMGYQTLGPFNTGEAAYASLTHTLPDLVLIGIHLAGAMNGVETVNKILEEHNLPIIYLSCNSNDESLAKAKATQPATFLTIPFRGRDLKHAINLTIIQAGLNEVSPNKRTIEQPLIMSDRLFIKHKNRLERIYFNDILWVEADNFYCRMYTKTNELLLTQTLSKLSDSIGNRLDFFRTHRSYLVNLQHIEQISDLHLYIGKKQIPISKSLRRELLNKLKTI